jgi:hypothetical protein
MGSYLSANNPSSNKLKLAIDDFWWNLSLVEKFEWYDDPTYPIEINVPSSDISSCLKKYITKLGYNVRSIEKQSINGVEHLWSCEPGPNHITERKS